MTRDELEQMYTIAHGRITSPGKFESERLYVPHFWNASLSGFSNDVRGDATHGFQLEADDLVLWPELVEDGATVGSWLWVEENDSGFVYGFLGDLIEDEL